MGIYSEYMNKRLSFQDLTSLRKQYLRKIARLRNREVLVYASDLNKNAPVSIMHADLIPFKDQLSYVNSRDIDIILETPGGIAEIVEDIVNLVRSKYEKVGIIVPGTAKSAGTIFAMAGDEILMGKSSSLGPIDAQVLTNGKRFSADAFLDGLEKIKSEVLSSGKLNPAYIPMLQNISPGEIQHMENAQNFSKSLVTKWLTNYKFKYWEMHSSTGETVTYEDKEKRAHEIAEKLCKHSDWLTHAKSIRIKDFDEMRLIILDYAQEAELEDAIERYYTLLRLTFDMTGIYKIFETESSQIYQSFGQGAPPIPNLHKINRPTTVLANFVCTKCSNDFKIQLNLEKKSELQKGAIAYPINDLFICPNCATITNISTLRLQVEAQTGMKVSV